MDTLILHTGIYNSKFIDVFSKLRQFILYYQDDNKFKTITPYTKQILFYNTPIGIDSYGEIILKINNYNNYNYNILKNYQLGYWKNILGCLIGDSDFINNFQNSEYYQYLSDYFREIPNLDIKYHKQIIDYWKGVEFDPIESEYINSIISDINKFIKMLAKKLANANDNKIGELIEKYLNKYDSCEKR